MQTLTFPSWLVLLKADAIRNGSLSAVRSMSSTVMVAVFAAGVAPKVDEILHWCTADPEQWLDTQETWRESAAA
jgi:hypothetical protein